MSFNFLCCDKRTCLASRDTWFSQIHIGFITTFSLKRYTTLLFIMYFTIPNEFNIQMKHLNFFIRHISVACDVGPKCELITQLFCPSKTISCNLIEFSMKFFIQNSIFSKSQNFEITFMKSYSSSDFQHQEHVQILL